MGGWHLREDCPWQIAGYCRKAQMNFWREALQETDVGRATHQLTFRRLPFAVKPRCLVVPSPDHPQANATLPSSVPVPVFRGPRPEVLSGWVLHLPVRPRRPCLQVHGYGHQGGDSLGALLEERRIVLEYN